MPETTRNLAAEWQRLVGEWGAAMAEYNAASTGEATSPDSSEGTAVDKAAQRLAEVKRKMDEVITAGREERRGRTDRKYLVVTTLDGRDAAAPLADDVEQSADPGTRPSASDVCHE